MAVEPAPGCRDAPITPRKNFFELGADRVAGMRGWDSDNFRRVRQKDRAPRRKIGNSAPQFAQRSSARRGAPIHARQVGTGEERREVGVHVARPTNICLVREALIHQASSPPRIGAIIA